jgi:hypothetical protein
MSWVADTIKLWQSIKKMAESVSNVDEVVELPARKAYQKMTRGI